MNYQNSKIYKIESITGEGQIYIGSTTKKYLCQRLASHKLFYKYWKEGKYDNVSSYIIFDLYGVDNCKITLLENVECQTKDELRAREGYYIKTLECVNKNMPGRTKKESNKKYRLENNDKIKAKKRESFYCVCGSKYTACHKQEHIRTVKHTQWLMDQVD